MTQFINKSTIKAEIERFIKEYRLSNSTEAKYRCEAYSELLDFINSLQEEPVSDDLEEAANNYVGHAPEIDEDLSCFTKRNAFIAGAQWHEEQCQKTIELAEDHAYLAGQEKMIEKVTSYIQQHWIWNTKMIEDFKNYMKGE